MKPITKVLASGLAALALAGAALAQGPGGPGHEGGRHAARHGGNFDPSAMAERRLASLKEKLKITGGQESQWSAFAARVKSDAETMKAQHAAHAQQSDLSAPDRMARHTEHMKQRIAAMEGTTAALRDLYAVLSTDQRAVADKHFAERGHGRRHGPRGPAQS